MSVVVGLYVHGVCLALTLLRPKGAHDVQTQLCWGRGGDGWRHCNKQGVSAAGGSNMTQA
jgi:hypothetical protein